MTVVFWVTTCSHGCCGWGWGNLDGMHCDDIVDWGELLVSPPAPSDYSVDWAELQQMAMS